MRKKKGDQRREGTKPARAAMDAMTGNERAALRRQMTPAERKSYLRLADEWGKAKSDSPEYAPLRLKIAELFERVRARGELAKGEPKPPKVRLATIKQEFDKLVLDYVATHDAPYDAIVFENVKDLHPGAKSTHNAEVQRLRRVVFSELGLKGDPQNNADVAIAIPLLKEKIQQKEAFVEATKETSDEAGKIGVPASDLKVGDSLEVEGEQVRVAKVGKN